MKERSAEAHKKKMQNIKKAVDKKIEKATEDRGVLIVITGNGKGKSSSGFGTVFRCLGHGFKAGVVQFIKGAMSTGEEMYLRNKEPDLAYHVMATGFTWETQDKEKDTAAALETWEKAEKLLQDENLRVVLLDEITYVINYGYLPLERVMKALQNRPKMQSVIVTGRGAPPEIVEIADTVSEIKEVKHAFKNGVKAQQGVEF